MKPLPLEIQYYIMEFVGIQCHVCKLNFVNPSHQGWFSRGPSSWSFLSFCSMDCDLFIG